MSRPCNKLARTKLSSCAAIFLCVCVFVCSGQIPQFGYCDEIDMSRLVSLRTSFKDQLEEEGLRFSYMPVLIKAISLALVDYPVMNAHVNDDCTAITYKADHNIGVAMDTPEGLVVPNIKQVQVHGSWFLLALHCVGFNCVGFCFVFVFANSVHYGIT